MSEISHKICQKKIRKSYKYQAHVYEYNLLKNTKYKGSVTHN